MRSFAVVRRAWVRAVVVVSFVAGCGAEVVEQTPVPASKTDFGTVVSSSMLGAGAEYRFAGLPVEGAIGTRLGGGYSWPAYADSINDRRLNPEGASPAGKYGEAFGVAQIEDLVSRYHGIDGFPGATGCYVDADCASEARERCGIRSGRSEGRCVPVDDGSAQAWASAALLWPTPLSDVIRNGVRVTPKDIQALLALSYLGGSRVGVGDGCTESTASRRLVYHQSVAGLTEPCLGTGPAAFHLLLGNRVGLDNGGFAVETLVSGVRSQRIVQAYTVRNLDEISGKEANGLLGIREGGFEDSQSGQVVKEEWEHLAPYVIKARDEIRVELTGDGEVDLYVRFDRESTEQAYACRPYLEGNEESCDLVAPEGASELYVSLLGDAEVVSSYEVKVFVGAQVPEQYQRNPQALQLMRVGTEVEYIAPGNVAGGPAEQRATLVYEYILELDELGRLLGGEWIGDSVFNDQAVFWAPTARSTRSLAGGAILFSDIEMLLRQSIGESSGRPLSVSESGSIGQGEWHLYGPYQALLGEFSVRLTGLGGNADLFVRQGEKSTETSFDCHPHDSDSNEECLVRGPGEFYVSVFGVSGSSYELEVDYVGPGDQ